MNAAPVDDLNFTVPSTSMKRVYVIVTVDDVEEEEEEEEDDDDIGWGTASALQTSAHAVLRAAVDSFSRKDA